MYLGIKQIKTFEDTDCNVTFSLFTVILSDSHHSLSSVDTVG